jgi:hypothetical protein
MLEKAKKRAEKSGVEVQLREMDIQNLDYADNYFDLIVTSCVFCSVPDPVQGLNWKILLKSYIIYGRGLELDMMQLKKYKYTRISFIGLPLSECRTNGLSFLTTISCDRVAFLINCFEYSAFSVSQTS